MRLTFLIILLLLFYITGHTQENSEPDFVWGNVSYFDVNCNESIYYNSIEIKALSIKNQFNTIKIGQDTVCTKVSKRSLAVGVSGTRIFVADNKHVKDLTDDTDVHGLLTKEVLLGVSEFDKKMLDPNHYIFPISFNDGFLWSAQEDSYMFSYLGEDKNEEGEYLRSYEGIGIGLHDARGIEKHWIVAIENSTVVWVEDENLDKMGKEACVLLSSDSNSEIYYVYNHLYNKTLEVRKGQKLRQGELIGTAWGDDKWGHLQLLVIKSDSVPGYENRFNNSINFFPQLYELYSQKTYSLPRSFTRGKIEFGKPAVYNNNQKNSAAFEEYFGKGWLFGKWNKTEKLESVAKGKESNVRLSKVIFSGENGRSVNPNNYFDYEINVPNGVYRIRAKVGDLFLPSWQKIEFEGVKAATYSLEAGIQKWTNECVIKVMDRKLSVHIYIDKENNKVAGLSEIVFQRAY